MMFAMHAMDETFTPLTRTRRRAAALLVAAFVSAGCKPSGDRSSDTAPPAALPASSPPARAPGSDAVAKVMPRAVIDLVTGSMSGRVLDADGRPLAGATLEVSTDWMTEEEKSVIRTTTTDSQGRYVISGLREHPGHSILVKDDAHAVGWLSLIVVERNAETRNPDIRLARGRTIRGRVLDESGKPIEGVLIKPRAQNIYFDEYTEEERLSSSSETQEDTTDGDGRYELRHLRPLRYDVHAWKDGFLAGQQDVWLGDVEAVDAPDIQLGPPLTFAVRVIDRAKRPIENAAILLQGHGFNHLPMLRTDAAGRIEVKGIESTPDRMEVSAPGYVTRASDDPPSGAEIILEPEAR